ncbi:unnamed protein product [Colias eurytheme]|nr:unnamed protein product [Colias eurytheme]
MKIFMIITVVLSCVWMLWDYASLLCDEKIRSCLEWQAIAEMNSHTVMVIILMILTAHYASIIMLIHIALIDVNARLSELQLEYYDDIQIKELASKIRSCSSSFLFISDTVKEVRCRDGLSILISLVLIVTRLTSLGCLALLLLSGMKVSVTHITVIAWIILQFCRLTMLVEPCHRINHQMKETIKLLNHLRYVWSEFESILCELEHFKRTIEMNEVTFSPLNLFTVDRALATKVFYNISDCYNIPVIFWLIAGSPQSGSIAKKLLRETARSWLDREK